MEILLAALFAIPCGYAVGVYLEDPAPYKIYVIANLQSDPETRTQILEPMAAQHRGKENPIAKIGDVPVLVDLQLLKDASPETAVETANDLVHRPDTLLVIGHMPSQATEASLPTYFGVRPAVPYLATIATDDNLLVKCDPRCYESGSFVPLLQLSPPNAEQGQSAVRFATQKGKRRFLIVSDNEPNNHSYRANMIRSYTQAVANFNTRHKDDPAEVVFILKMDSLPTEQQLKIWQPDCVLYAGSFGEAHSLWRALSQLPLRSPLMMVTSDSVVESRGNDHALAEFNSAQQISVRFTYQTDAADYNNHKSVYGQDSFAIATQLISDLNQRGGDLRFRMKNAFHIHNVADARRSLRKIMLENSSLRIWYAGADGEQYVFKGHSRLGGLFHVWQLSSASSTSWEMEDIDNWHIPRNPSERARVAELATQ